MPPERNTTTLLLHVWLPLQFEILYLKQVVVSWSVDEDAHAYLSSPAFVCPLVQATFIFFTTSLGQETNYCPLKSDFAAWLTLLRYRFEILFFA
jgi:hypothetical protein